MKNIGLKEFRQNMETYLGRAQSGESFTVLKRAKPVFKVVPIDEGQWEEVIDFTKIKKGGVDIADLLKRL